MSNMTTDEKIKLNKLANGFASERGQDFFKEVTDNIDLVDGAGTDIAKIKQTIGKALAIAYAKGYADCFDRIEPRKSIFTM